MRLVVFLVTCILGMNACDSGQSRFTIDDGDRFFDDCFGVKSDGRIQGRVKCFQNGNLIVESNVRNDTLNGEYKEWYPSGKLRIRSNYFEGKEVGESFEYYENGVVRLHSVLNAQGDKLLYSVRRDSIGSIIESYMLITSKLIDDQKLFIGDTAQFSFKLEYSIYDSVGMYLFFDLDEDYASFEDSVYVESSEFVYKIPLVNSGRKRVRGTLLEVGSREYLGGEQDFEVKYYVEEK